MGDILTIQSLSKGFSRQVKNSAGEDIDEQYWVIHQLFLNVPRGKVIALIGGNGAGKTTLFNIISGFIMPDSGSILYKPDGKNLELSGMSPHLITRAGIGRMFQDNHIFREMSVLDNMLVADSAYLAERPFRSLLFRNKNRKEENCRLAKAMDIFENLFVVDNPFLEKRKQPAGNLSYGQQRLLGLARLFMRNYELLLLDEPTAGVNPEVIEQIKQLILNFIKNNQTVLLIEHNLEVVKDIADFCCYMENGRIALMGTPEDVIGNEEVQKSYMGL
ncbi:MAG: ATP-binding cassette domain-containing protein [Bacteroidales bacterium]|nr:ATP-binding cassette domain-containing protein [Bacteroidales bacterium]